jgi:aspartyl-tRNA(Asn)/glutamyl-tRNA(Gln) amidotransferase subunit A
VETLSACVARIERWQPQLNCFLRVEPRAAKQSGPLAGVALAHKDMFYREGEVSTCGAQLRRNWIAPETATVLSRLDASGASDLGRLNMSEFAYGVTGHNQAFGDCRNPWNPAYITGGSSSGSAAAVAAALCFGALGSDTGGSIRAPSGMCGVTGLKTTWGRVSRSGAMPLAPSLDTIGPIARSAADCARLLQAIAGRDERDPQSAREPVPDYGAAVNESVHGLRIALPSAWIERECDPVIARAVAEAAAEFARQGTTIVESAMPDLETLSAHCLVVMQAEAAAIHARWLREDAQRYESQTRARLEPGLATPATAYLGALRMRGPSLERFCSTVLEEADVFMLPIMRRLTPTLAETGRGSGAEGARAIGEITRLLLWVNYLGLPAIALPCGFDPRGLPIGLQVIGRPFAEPLLLRAGAAYQRETGWHTRAPEQHRSHP